MQLAQTMASESEIVGQEPFRFRPLIRREEIQLRVDELALKLREDYRDKHPVLVGVLNGCFIFMADLIRAMNIPCDVDFLKLSSYRDAMKSGEISLIKDLNANIEGRHVILVEDIVDSGKSLAFLRQHLRDRKPASLVMAAMFIKHGTPASADAEYVGMEIPDEFVVGYGLDYAQEWRQLPDLYVLVKED
jgi:hypoxanthine phosphoribosyltransferase